MNGTITIILVWLSYCYWHMWYHSDVEQEEEEEKEEKQPITAADIWANPIMVASGLQNPYVLIDSEEVDLEEWDNVEEGRRMPRFLKDSDLTIIND